MNEFDKPKPEMKIAGINLVILIGYTVATRLTAFGKHGEDILGNALLLAIIIVVHVLVCIFIGAASITQTKPWLLSALLVLLIGFSSCWLAFSL